MLFVNTISYDGEKAVINSYTIGYVLGYEQLCFDMVMQQMEWAAEYPNAVVQTETLPDHIVIPMVCAVRDRKAPSAWTIGQNSKNDISSCVR